jgi:hypothetical protein
VTKYIGELGEIKIENYSYSLNFVYVSTMRKTAKVLKLGKNDLVKISIFINERGSHLYCLFFIEL